MSEKLAMFEDGKDGIQVGGIFPAMARLAKSTEPDPSLEEGFVQAVSR